MKKALFSTVFLFVISVAYSQQDAQLSMNVFNRLAVNPAYAGVNNSICGKAFYRRQWVGFEGAPETGVFSLDYGRVLHGGIGLTIDQDKIGVEKLLKAKLAYSYHQVLNVGVLNIGIDAGIIQQSLSNNLKTADGQQIDPSVPFGGGSGMTYDLGFGLYYHTNQLFVGLSSTHLPGRASTLTFDGGSGNGRYTYSAARHYYVMAGYTFRPDVMWEIVPSILTKTVFSVTQVDVNVMAKWRQQFFFGTSYRHKDAVVLMGGADARLSPKVTGKFGYAYDITLSGLNDYSGGSHEIMLGLCYRIVPEGTLSKYHNQRYL